MTKNKTKRDDRTEIEMLRFSIAKIAKLAGAATESLPVTFKSEEELIELCMTQNKGWVELCNRIEDEIKWMDQLLSIGDG